MPDKPQLFLGLRKENGQIGYISEGLNIPDFFNLIRPVENNKNVLVDFSPVIKTLHELHKSKNDENIRNKYNIMYNYWQDAKTYKKEAIKSSKSEQLSILANELINDMQGRLQNKENEFFTLFYSSRNYNDIYNIEKAINNIKIDCDMYIDTLLCFIHSKASLEISSFKADFILGSYCDFIENIVFNLFKMVITSGYDKDSFLKSLAFQNIDELQSYLHLISPGESDNDFILRIVKNTKPYDEHDDNYGYLRVINIPYSFNSSYYNIAKILKDLIYRIRSVKQMLVLLKEDDIEWSSDQEYIDQLTLFLKKS